jgi:hypothetical protein
MSGPPLASSWAAAPTEFYLDENACGRTVRRRLVDLGYIVHTPGELFGSWNEARGTEDEDWLPLIGRHRWAVIGTDLKIFERPQELSAYRSAKINAFLLPGQSKVTERIALIDACLAEMCAKCAARQVDVWKMTNHGLERYPIPGGPRRSLRR